MKTESPNRTAALVSPAPTGGALADRAASTLALARARAALNPPTPCEVVHVPMTCARTGLTFIGVGKRDQNCLVLSAVARLPTGRGQSSTAGVSAGFYSSVQFPDGWRCPGCRRPHSGTSWFCDCEPLRGAMHVCGDEGRAGICACGKTETCYFGGPKGGEVRGSSHRAHPTLPSLSAAPRAVIPSRTPPLMLPGRKG